MGAVWGLETVWTLSDIANALLAIPNLIGVIALSGIVKKEILTYDKKLKKSGL